MHKAQLTEEDFELWRLNPVTEIVLAYLDQKVVEADQLWSNRLRDPAKDASDLFSYQIDLAARVDTILQMRHLAYEDLSDEPNNNVTPIRKSNTRS